MASCSMVRSPVAPQPTPDVCRPSNALHPQCPGLGVFPRELEKLATVIRVLREIQWHPATSFL
jgi:hypothetical protein